MFDHHVLIQDVYKDSLADQRAGVVGDAAQAINDSTPVESSFFKKIHSHRSLALFPFVAMTLVPDDGVSGSLAALDDDVARALNKAVTNDKFDRGHPLRSCMQKIH